MRRFRLLEPRSLDDACGLLLEHEGARPIAGGTAMLVLIKQGLYVPDMLVNLKKVLGASELTYDPHEGLRVGALATLYEIETSPLVREHYPMLASACHVVANIRIRNAATIGGNVAHGDYQSDPPAALLALEASVELARADGKRQLPLEEFLLGTYETALEPGEVVSALLVPPPTTTRATYMKFTTHSSEDRPCAGVAAVIDLRDGECRDMRLVVGAVSSRPMRIRDAEALAKDRVLTGDVLDAIAAAAANAVEPISDLHGSEEYKRRVVRALTRRALAGCLGNGEIA